MCKKYEQDMRAKGREPHGRPPFFRPKGKGKGRSFDQSGKRKIKGKGKGRQSKSTGKGGGRGKTGFTVHTKACPALHANQVCSSEQCEFSHDSWRLPKLQRAIARQTACNVAHWPEKYEGQKHPSQIIRQTEGLAVPSTLKEVAPFAGYAEDCDFDEGYISEANYSDTQSAYEFAEGQSIYGGQPIDDEDDGDSSYVELLSDDSMFAGDGWHD